MERVAECHCTQLRVITSGESDSVYVCHCKACQRRTSAVIHNGSRWPKNQVRVEGEHKFYGRIADSGFVGDQSARRGARAGVCVNPSGTSPASFRHRLTRAFTKVNEKRSKSEHG
jgi:hypothetical protein